MKSIICCLKAIPFFIRSGVWRPHLYNEESREEAIIIATENSFRIANDYTHKPHETVHPKAMLIRNKCVHCGKEDLSWFDGEIPVIKTE